MAEDILLVHPNPILLARLATVLTTAGYRVRLASSFEDAKQLLSSEPPVVLVTAIRLGPFNGLHLVLRGRADRPGMGACVIDASWDPTLEADARRYGAAYLAEPLDGSILLEKVAEILVDVSRPPAPKARRSERKSVPPGVTAKIAALEARLINVSYEGLCFVLPARREAELSPSFEVQLPGIAWSINGKMIWMDCSRPEGTMYGAAISQAEPGQVHAWRQFVDDLR